MMEKFSRELNGYNKEEVTQFLNDTISQVEGMIQKIQDQADKLQAANQKLQDQNRRLQEQERVIHSLNDKINENRPSPEALEKAILMAQETADNMKLLAKKEANGILQDAKHNANRIVNDALIRAERIELKADTLERNVRIFKKKMKSVIEQQMAVVDEIEDLELK